MRLTEGRSKAADRITPSSLGLAVFAVREWQVRFPQKCRRPPGPEIHLSGNAVYRPQPASRGSTDLG